MSCTGLDWSFGQGHGSSVAPLSCGRDCGISEVWRGEIAGSGGSDFDNLMLWSPLIVSRKI